MKRILLIALTVVNIQTVIGQFAGFQRMLIPVGEYVINGASFIPSFCIDEALSPPSSLDYFVNSSANIYVKKTKGNTSVTRPLSEVNGKWVRVSGNDEGINTVKVEPVNPNDGSSYKFIIRNNPGFIGGRGQSVTTNLPNATVLSTFNQSLNSITDGEMRTFAKQRVVWKIRSNAGRAEIPEFLRKIRQINNQYSTQLNSITDSKSRNALKNYIIDVISEGFAIEEIQSLITKSISEYITYDKVKSFFKNDIQAFDNLQYNVDLETLSNLIDNNHLQLSANGKLSEESQKLLTSLVDTKNDFYRYGLDCCESIFDNIKKIQKENGLPETGFPSIELIDFLKEYGKPFEVIKEYRNKGTSDYVLAESGIFSDGYIVRINDKTYLFDGYSKPQILTSEKVADIESNFRKSVNRYSEDQGNITFISIGSREDASKQIKIQIGTTETSVQWENLNSYEEIFAAIDNHIKEAKDEMNFVLSKDMFAKGKIGWLDKPNENSLYGSKFLNGKYVENRTWINYSEILRELQKRHPGKRIYLGGDFFQDRNAIRNLPKIKKGSDIAAYIAPKSVEMTFDQVASMKNKLTSSGIVVHELDDEFANVPKQIAQANILLLSGHKERRYETFLMRLADEGLLMDKVVAVFSCNEQGTAMLNSYLIKKGFARKVIFFPSKIDVTAINAVFSELSELTKNITVAEGVLFDELIDEAIEKALNNPRYEDLRAEIILFKEFIKQTSFIINPFLNKNSSNG